MTLACTWCLVVCFAAQGSERNEPRAFEAHQKEVLRGTEGEGMSLLIGTVLAVVLLIVVFVIMFKVDWEKRAEKYLKDTETPPVPPQGAS